MVMACFVFNYCHPEFVTDYNQSYFKSSYSFGHLLQTENFLKIYFVIYIRMKVNHDMQIAVFLLTSLSLSLSLSLFLSLFLSISPFEGPIRLLWSYNKLQISNETLNGLVLHVAFILNLMNMYIHFIQKMVHALKFNLFLYY